MPPLAAPRVARPNRRERRRQRRTHAAAPRPLLDEAARYHRAGDLARAEALYREILRQAPDDPDAHHLLGLIAHQTGHHEAAVRLIEQAIRGKPDFAGAYSNLALAYRETGRLDEALAAARRGVALAPRDLAARLNLGTVYEAGGALEEALAAYDAARALAGPADPRAEGNRAVVLQALGRFDDARSASEAALARDPDYAVAHFVRGTLLLLAGRFAEGWRDYEWRFRDAALLKGALRRALPGERWDGGALDGRTVLVHADQGFGDAIQFVRYLPLVARRGGRVVLECQPALTDLFSALPGVDSVVAQSESGAPAIAFDCHVPLTSLPGLFGTTLDSIPADIPYLQAPPARIDAWRDRLAGPGLAVGLVWAGGADLLDDSQRSLDLAMLAPLADIPHMRVFGLQKGPAAENDAAPFLENLGPDLTDFTETAAAIMALDLVISVDTAVAHLAGALGRPVWTLLPFSPDFRWMLDRTDSPWYPGMRLFRQAQRGQWHPVIAAVAEALAERAASAGPG